MHLCVKQVYRFSHPSSRIPSKLDGPVEKKYFQNVKLNWADTVLPSLSGHMEGIAHAQRDALFHLRVDTKNVPAVMNKLIQIWLPFLVIALSFALYVEFSSVEKVSLDPVYGDQAESRPLQQSQPARQAAPRVASRLAVGARFASHTELVDDQLAAGFLRVGTFGKQWPATVTEIATNKDEIRFIRQGGTPHYYPKFDGYDMKMVRLMDGNQETILVFRSAHKR